MPNKAASKLSASARKPPARWRASPLPATPLAANSRADQRLDVAVAFAAASRGAHEAARDHSAGLLAPGQRADLAVWDVPADLVDPRTGLPRMSPGDPLPSCVATLAGGRAVHLADGAFA